MNDFITTKKNFEDSINNPSLGFKDIYYEKKYVQKKFKKTNLNTLIIGSLLFVFLLDLLINAENYCESTYRDFGPIEGSQPRLLKDRPMDDSPSKENKPPPPPDGSRNVNNSITFIIMSSIGIGLEIGIFFIKKVKLLRGFIFIIILLVQQIITAISTQNTFQSKRPLYDPNAIYKILSLLVICFLYSANWICGSLQVVCIVVAIDINLFSNPWNMEFDYPFQLILSFVCCFTLIVTIFNLEYFQRKTFFRRMESEKQRKAMKGILQKLPEPLIIAQKGIMEWSNEPFNNLSILLKTEEMQFTNESIIPNTKRNSTDLYNLDYQNILKYIKNQAETQTIEEIIKEEKKLIEDEFAIIILNKKVKYYEITSMEFSMGVENSILYLMKDITNFKKVNDLKNKKKFQRVYFASITHDFRTPLSIISGNSELLSDMEDNPEKTYLVKNIRNAAILLSLLVQDILDFSQIKAGTLRINIMEFNLYDEFNIIIELFKEKYNSKGLYLELKIAPNVPVIVSNDANRLKQILVNLISNAFKFTLNGGVLVEIVTDEIVSGDIVVRVIDTGVGMEEEDMKKLFKEFGKLEKHSELNPNGIGLGLKICKQIIEKLGGNITVKSKLGLGTTFQLTFAANLHPQNQFQELKKIRIHEESKINQELSLKPIQANTCNNNFEENKNFHEVKYNIVKNEIKNEPILFSCQCPKVLIVDDDLNLRRIISMFANRMNIKNDQAENGLEALDKIKLKLKNDCCRFYDIVFIDFYMPFMNGIEASLEIERILSLEFNFIKTKIILISGLSPDEHTKIQQLPHSPFSLIESKPLAFSRFKEIVNKTFQND